MNISAWKVRTRLAMGFGSVCALLLIIVLVGLYSLSRIEEGLTSVVNDRMPKIEAAHAIQTQTDAIAIALRNMMLTSDAADRQKQAEAITQARKVAAENVEMLDKLVAAPKGKELLNNLKEQRTKYQAGQEALTALILADKADEAKTYLNSQLRPVLASYRSTIVAMMAFQVQQMNATAKTAVVTYEQAHFIMIGLGLLALALAAVVGTLITRSLLKELGGEPGKASELARAVAQGDFSRTVAVKTNDTDSLMANLATMQGNLAQVVTTVRRGSEGVATASAEIAQGNQDLSARTEQQASALEQTAASMEELGATVKQNAESAQQANQLAKDASTVAVQGGTVVSQVVETMKGINESSRKISDIISVIDGIAFQTNILALNAAVEAARAGEQGRGFAVVASEVRSLAGRSADAAKEIKLLINASVERVEHGTVLVDQAGATMTAVVDSIKRVTDIMGEISSASNEQASGVTQVGEAVTQMDQTTQQNAALVEEMAAAASSLKNQATQLVQAVAFFQLGDQQVLRKPGSAQPETVVRSAARPAPQVKDATSHRPTAKARAIPRPATAVPVLPTKAQSKSVSAGGDDWETF